jgi:Zn-finger nucleic acid-binding protein
MMVYNEKFQFWFCPKCKGEFWEDSEELKELREIAKEKIQGELLRQMYKGHLWSPSWKEPLPPVCVWIRKSQGHRKRRKSRKRHQKSVEEWLAELSWKR